MIVTIPPTLSAVRTVQKVIRKLTQCVGGDAFTYLDVSKFEIAPAAAGQWLNSAGFTLDRMTSFDPILPAASLRVFRPALVILEAHKTVRQ
jgi:hypothetical protein